MDLFIFFQLIMAKKCLDVFEVLKIFKHSLSFFIDFLSSVMFWSSNSCFDEVFHVLQAFSLFGEFFYDLTSLFMILRAFSWFYELFTSFASLFIIFRGFLSSTPFFDLNRDFQCFLMVNNLFMINFKSFVLILKDFIGFQNCIFQWLLRHFTN